MMQRVVCKRESREWEGRKEGRTGIEYDYPVTHWRLVHSTMEQIGFWGFFNERQTDFRWNSNDRVMALEVSSKRAFQMQRTAHRNVGRWLGRSRHMGLGSCHQWQSGGCKMLGLDRKQLSLCDALKGGNKTPEHHVVKGNPVESRGDMTSSDNGLGRWSCRYGEGRDGDVGGGHSNQQVR